MTAENINAIAALEKDYQKRLADQLEYITKTEALNSQLTAENLVFKKTLTDIDRALPAKIDFWWVITNGPRILRLIAEWVKAIREIIAK